jgi:hypothetical protein
MPVPTDLVTDLPADFEVFGQAVDTQMKTNADAATQKATLTTKGDIYAATGASTPARLGVGTNDQVLTADSTAATGMKWATSAAGGMTLISTTTFNGTPTTLLSSIPQTYNDLRIVIKNPIAPGTGTYLSVRLNNDATASRYRSIFFGDNYSNNQTFNDNQLPIADTMASSTSQGLIIIDISDYTNTTTWKTIVSYSTTNNATTTTNTAMRMDFGSYNQTAAISSLGFIYGTGNPTSGTILLYGVK